MNLSGKTIATAAFGAAAGALLTTLVLRYAGSPAPMEAAGAIDGKEREPLYWVAPMDPEYRRDAPGKSPMGMDLVPVYAEDAGPAADRPGTVAISPAVVNSLGVRTALAAHRPLQAEIRTVGYVHYDEDRLIHIHPRVEGWIEKLFVKASGDPVERGQPLYALYSPQLVNAQEEFLLALKRDNRRLIRAAEDRLLALQLSPGFIASLREDRAVRQTVTFQAPQSGVVDNLNIREGFYVVPNTMIMSIGALDEVWVQAEVFERQAERVRVGQPVTMTLDYLPGQEWRGRVDYVYPSLDEQTRTLGVRLRFDNNAGTLRPNMFAQVVIDISDGAEDLTVPREAVIRTGQQDRVVLALGEGRFRSVAVRLGGVDDEYAQILEGLDSGDSVVVSAQFLLDSESSRSADFARMEAPAETDRPGEAGSHDHHMHGDAGHD